jgi:CRP/FNR family transcriptional regulator, anaerobic regulatory protein
VGVRDELEHFEAFRGLFNDLRYPAWVQAEVATSTAVIPGPLYRRLFETEPSIQDLTVRTLSTLVYRLMGELEQVHTLTHGQRLAQLFLSRASREGRVAMTQQRLAQHLGTTREVVARLMQGFVARRLVRTRRGLVELKDLDGLRGVVRGDRPQLSGRGGRPSATPGAAPLRPR